MLFRSCCTSPSITSAFGSVLPPQPVRHKVPANSSIPNSLYFCIFMFPSSSICTDMFHFAFLGHHGLHSPDALFRPACSQTMPAKISSFYIGAWCVYGSSPSPCFSRIASSYCSIFCLCTSGFCSRTYSLMELKSRICRISSSVSSLSGR